jgi:hypothetical protein
MLVNEKSASPAVRAELAWNLALAGFQYVLTAAVLDDSVWQRFVVGVETL